MIVDNVDDVDDSHVLVGDVSAYNSKNQEKQADSREIKYPHFKARQLGLKMWMMWITRVRADFRRFLRYLRPP